MDELAFEQVIRSFANECGGRLLLSIQTEKRALAAGESVHEPPERFGVTKQIFIDAGKSETEHQLWRQSELRPLCERFLLYLINKSNPHFFLPDEELELKPKKPIKEPEITREQLETDVAQWYLREERLNGFEYPESDHDELKGIHPKSVGYHAWQHSSYRNREKTEAKEEVEGVCPNQQQQPLPAERKRKGNLEKISASDLEEKLMTANGVVKWLKATKPQEFAAKKSGDPEISEEDMSKALSDAASRASKGRPEGVILDPPIRISKANGRWYGVAIFYKGETGLGKGNQYKLIKNKANTEE
jgi:hypothetical protein